ncbi:4Fe-4S binding protein [Xanthobacteraceae bacterium Astr-EGSB]|uniref:4Fe-4S binding protein n=1 Tax=Astrobacterium formosum TaxID=3069710 RepID=UPI0027B7653E|nr:4Fe-4S binding protein [Xanthobacteraceae bacterium Astr-EGSB]
MPSKLDILVSACATLGRRGLAVRNELCLRARHRASDCERCSESCPAGAIAVVEGVVLSPALCNGCGACATLCPSGALTACEPSDAQLRFAILRHVKNSGVVAFACETYLAAHVEDRPKVVAVPCIARLDESILLDAVVAGASHVGLVDAACADCPQAKLHRTAATVVNRLNKLLSAWSHRAAVEFVADLSGSKPLVGDTPRPTGVSRRAFFTALRSSKAKASRPGPPETSEAGGAVIPKGGQPKEVPDRRRRIMASLRRLGPATGTASLDGSVWATMTVSAGCNGCGICVAACPTAALDAKDEDGAWRLSFLVANCIRCGLCASLCVTKALRIDAETSIDSALDATPRVLVTRAKSDVVEATAPLDERFSRLFGRQITF